MGVMEVERETASDARALQMLVDGLLKERQTWRAYTYKVISDESSMIGRAQRDRTVRWLVQLTERFNFHPETLFLAVNIMDRFLAAVKAHSKYLSCVGAVCLYLAAKLSEENEMIPTTLTLVRQSESGCSVAEVLRMERCILDKLGWNLIMVTPLDFLQILHSLVLTDCPGLLDGFSQATPLGVLGWMTAKLRHCLAAHELLQYAPSTQAMAILSLELDLCRPDLNAGFMTSLNRFIQADVKSLAMCKELIAYHVTRSGAGPYSTRFSYRRRIQPSNIYAFVKPTKRKISHHDDDDDDDNADDDAGMYDGIRHLYEDGSACIAAVHA